MKLKTTRFMAVLALAAGALAMTPSARAATAGNGDILLGVRASAGTGATKNFVINLGQASQFETASTPVALGNIGADLTSTFGASWNTRSNVFWGIAGTVGSFTPIGSNPAKTVYGSRSIQTPWLRQNDATQGSATNKLRALNSAFTAGSSVEVTAPNAVLQNTTDTNSWSSYQPGGTTANAGPAPGTSFAFFNPGVEANFGGGVAGANLYFYRIKPAVNSSEIDTAGDYLGVFSISSGGDVTFTSPAAQAAGAISFSSAIYSVDQGATTVALTLNRTGGTAPTSVTINTTDGTASSVPPFKPAVSGTDYTDLAGAATTVAFAQDEMTKTVNVTLIPQSSMTTPNKRFSAVLSSPAGTATLGSVSEASIRILAANGASPTLKITTPSSVLDSGAWPYAVKGTAGAALGVDHVQVTLNGGAPVTASLGAATSNTAVPWSVSIQPQPGLNTVVATVYDLSGNTASVRRVFSFTRRYTLSIIRDVPAAVAAAPDSAGNVTMMAAPSANATSLPTTANANPKVSTIVPGTTVKLSTTTKSGYVFSHWSGAPAGAVAQGGLLTFTMPQDDPAVTAVFVANPFAGPAGSGTAFYGLIHPEAGTASSNATEGFLTGVLTASSGAFSGKLYIDGLYKSFTATFFGNGSALFTVGSAKQSTLSFNGKTLTLSYADNAITATVTAGSDTSVGTAARTIYSSTHQVPATLLNSSTKGFYTLGFPSKAQTPAVATSTYPQGDGFATISLSNLGVVSVSGTLADGSTITGSSGLIAGNVCPIFVQLNTPGSSAKGASFGGTLTFDHTPADSDVTGIDLLWLRPAVTELSSPAAAAAATRLYTAGWPEGIKVDAVGALYDKTMTVQSTLGAPVSSSANVDLVFEGGKLTTPTLTKPNIKITGNTVTKLPSTDSTFTLSVMGAMGTFNGTFVPNWTNPDTVKPGYKGILIQKGVSKGGFGYFLSNAKNDLDPQSGGVTLSAKE